MYFLLKSKVQLWSVSTEVKSPKDDKFKVKYFFTLLGIIFSLYRRHRMRDSKQNRR